MFFLVRFVFVGVKQMVACVCPLLPVWKSESRRRYFSSLHDSFVLASETRAQTRKRLQTQSTHTDRHTQQQQKHELWINFCNTKDGANETDSIVVAGFCLPLTKTRDKNIFGTFPSSISLRFVNLNLNLNDLNNMLSAIHLFSFHDANHSQSSDNNKGAGWR